MSDMSKFMPKSFAIFHTDIGIRLNGKRNYQTRVLNGKPIKKPNLVRIILELFSWKQCERARLSSLVWSCEKVYKKGPLRILEQYCLTKGSPSRATQHLMTSRCQHSGAARDGVMDTWKASDIIRRTPVCEVSGPRKYRIDSTHQAVFNCQVLW